MMYSEEQLCSYYQAKVRRQECWLLTATLRSFEHLAFDRTVDKQNSVFEFFVPRDTERYFLEIMAYYESTGLISEFKKLPNRLADGVEAL